MADYSLSRIARTKISHIYEYSLLTFGERQADIYVDSLFETFDHLAKLPNMGRAWRRWRRHEHAEHVIFYMIKDDGIEIVDVFHHGEDIVSKMKS
jgi:toxin ParE1/3/4